MKLERDLRRLDEDYDVVVIGGGISGIAVAREAAVRSLRTCLVEKNDFAWATSAATSKLLHGGLRYLENYEFGLVRESLAERRIVGLAAPHLVQPLPFLIPIYEGQDPGRFMLFLGLTLYDLLSFDRNRGVPGDKYIPGHTWLKAEEVTRLAPDIDPEGLKGAYLYYDYQSLYPERLALDWALTAARDGAALFNHMEVRNFDLKADAGTKRVESIEVRDTLSDKSHRIRGKLFVNATGPWMDITLGLAEEKPDTQLSRSTGIHFITKPVLDHEKSAWHHDDQAHHPRTDRGPHAVLFKTKSGRHFFALPWEGKSLIGPTDIAYEDDPDVVAPRDAEVAQLFGDVNETLAEHAGKQRPIEAEDIEHIIVGIRPLIFSGKNTYRASRKSEIYDHSAGGIEGLVSVAGGKWTTSRNLGVDVIKRLLKKRELQGFKAPKIDTRKRAFVSASGFGDSARDYIEFAIREYQTPGVDEATHRHLATVYGVRHRDVLALVREEPALAERIAEDRERLDILAQVDFAVTHESACTLDDILRRRLVLGPFGYPGDRALQKIAGRAGKLLRWSAEQRKKEIQSVQEIYRRQTRSLQVLGGKNASAKKSKAKAASRAGGAGTGEKVTDARREANAKSARKKTGSHSGETRGARKKNASSARKKTGKRK